MSLKDVLAARRKAALAKAKGETIPAMPPDKPAEPVPQPAEGQFNPPDSPGVEDVTTAQLDDIASTARAAMGDAAGAGEVRLWLRSRGRSELVRAGLGLAHIPRILAHMFPGADEEGAAAARRGADAPEPPAPEPPAPEPPAPEPPAPGAPGDIVGEAAEPQDEHTVQVKELVMKLYDWLQANKPNGERASKEDIKPIIRDHTGRKRIDDRVLSFWLYGQHGALAVGESCGFWDYGVDDTGLVWLTGGVQEPDEDESGAVVLSQPDPTPTPAAQPNTDPSPAAAPPRASSWASMVILVDALPSSTVPMVTLDDLLSDYFEEAARSNGAAHYTLIEYNKGPSIVAANVIGDVREGRFEPVRGFLIVDGAHPMARFLPAMFPDALIIRRTGS